MWIILVSRSHPTIDQKINQILDRFWKGSGSVLGGFSETFGWILGYIFMDFGTIFVDLGEKTMIRATKGTSMDGWRSTNHWKGGWMVWLGPKRLVLF